ncbi:MAG: hypothetical protein GYA23_07670 [Methanomicrobiales archaeon]|nr:hypothetical protein [Methanomicrobiales archaeon]
MNVSRDKVQGIRSRKPVTILILLAATILLITPVMAHAPDVIIDVNKAASTISILIAHPSENTSTHYIKHVKVVQNGRTVVDNYYKSQPTPDTFSYTYPVPVNAGDTLRATVTCTSGDYNEAVLTLATPTSTAPPTIMQTQVPEPPVTPVTTTQKSPVGLLALPGLLIGGVLLLALNRRE